MEHSFLDRYSTLKSPIHSLNAKAKIVTLFLLLIISVSTDPRAYYAFAVYAAVVFALILMSKVPLKYVLKKSLIIIPFVLMVTIFIPFLKKDVAGGGISLGISDSLTVSRSGLLIFFNVLVKSYIGVLTVILLSSTTSFSKLLRGFEELKVPKFMIMLASFTYRYLFILADEVIKMKRARDSRCFGGKWIWHVKTIGHMIGTLFLRSYERGERIYIAMVSRGYEGEFNRVGHSTFKAGDLVFMSSVILIVLSVRIFAV
jgi:cobalt/nickel transport system permease protein